MNSYLRASVSSFACLWSITYSLELKRLATNASASLASACSVMLSGGLQQVNYVSMDGYRAERHFRVDDQKKNADRAKTQTQSVWFINLCISWHEPRYWTWEKFHVSSGSRTCTRYLASDCNKTCTITAQLHKEYGLALIIFPRSALTDPRLSSHTFASWSWPLGMCPLRQLARLNYHHMHMHVYVMSH